MTLILDDRVFVHVPRTGGMWFRKFLEVNGIAYLPLRGDDRHHMPHSALPKCLRDLPSLAFVRHPLFWVKSRWAHALRYSTPQDGRHHGLNRRFDELVCERLADTVKAIVEQSPGLVGDTFAWMTDGVSSVRRTEDLEWASKSFVGKADAEAPKDRINGILDQFTWRSLAVMPESLEKEFLDSEKATLERWGYV